MELLQTQLSPDKEIDHILSKDRDFYKIVAF